MTQHLMDVDADVAERRPKHAQTTHRPVSLDPKTREQLGLAAWTEQLGTPHSENRSAQVMARVGGIVALTAIVTYLCWRVFYTMPTGGWNLYVASALIIFEALPIIGLTLKLVTTWNIDCPAPPPVATPPNGMRVAVLIPTYNEPAEVIAPTIAAACALEPAHQTWVLDDGDRDWVAELCAEYGARYVRRAQHDHAKAGNLNNALDVMAREAAQGAPEVDIIAVLDCDHVPLPSFLSATLGWFADDRIALVQGPQAFYNSGAFDDDGSSGEQGLFFNVLMPARHQAEAGPFWCGSTSLLRVAALREVGGVATETITEDMHTTLKLIKRGWLTAYHHQTLALGLAPSTSEQYLLQRRRWGMGAMQILIHERLWSAKRWLSWRNFHEYLMGTLWWLEGVATLVAFAVPLLIMFSGAKTCTANPFVFAAVFVVAFYVRLWGVRRLLRKEIHWPTAFSLRILRLPVGLACIWWLVSRQVLTFQVTPKGADTDRQRGMTPQVIQAVAVVISGALVYAAFGVAGLVPWHDTPGSTVASGVWLIIAGFVLLLGIRRIHAAEYASSRRKAHRVPVQATILVDGVEAELIDISVGGAAVRLPENAFASVGVVEVQLPGAEPIEMMMARLPRQIPGHFCASLQTIGTDWHAYRTMALWLFHTPEGAVPGLPDGVPAVAIR